MQNLLNLIVLQGLLVKEKARKVLTNERGEANIIAIILILAIVIALAIIFRNQLTSLFNRIWTSLFSNVDNVLT